MGRSASAEKSASAFPGLTDEPLPVGPFKTTGDVEVPAEGEEECIICFAPLKVVGRLNECTHMCFCFDCIEAWSKTENRCPVCRKRFTTLSKIDLSEGKGKGKSRRKGSPKVVKVQTRDQSSSYAARGGRGNASHVNFLEPFAHDFFFELASAPAFGIPSSQPGWMERRRAEPAFPPYSRRDMEPPFSPSDFFLSDFVVEDLARGMARAGGTGTAAANERTTAGGSQSETGPAAARGRPIEQVIEFSQRIRSGTGGIPPAAVARGRGSSVARGGGGSSSSSSSHVRSTRPTSAIGGSGSVRSRIVLDDTDDPEVSVVEERVPVGRVPPYQFQIRNLVMERGLEPDHIVLEELEDPITDGFVRSLISSRFGRGAPSRAPGAATGASSSSSSSSGWRRQAPEVIELLEDDDGDHSQATATSVTGGGLPTQPTHEGRYKRRRRR